MLNKKEMKGTKYPSSIRKVLFVQIPELAGMVANDCLSLLCASGKDLWGFFPTKVAVCKIRLT